MLNFSLVLVFKGQINSSSCLSLLQEDSTNDGILWQWEAEVLLPSSFRAALHVPGSSGRSAKSSGAPQLPLILGFVVPEDRKSVV